VFTARHGLGTYIEAESVYCAVRTGYLYRGGECLMHGTYWVLI